VIGGRIPAEVEGQVRQLMTNYAGNITSVLCQFPSQQIAEALDAYAGRLQKKQEREVFFMTSQVLLSLVQRCVTPTRFPPHPFLTLAHPNAGTGAACAAT